MWDSAYTHTTHLSEFEILHIIDYIIKVVAYMLWSHQVVALSFYYYPIKIM